MTINLKNMKESRDPSASTIELIESDTFFCLIDAFVKFSNLVGRPPPSFPLMQANGKCLMTNKFNRTLKDVLGLDGEDISSHSFRAGLVTSLARAGASDEVIKATGRWSLEAYRAYMKKTCITHLRDQKIQIRCPASLSLGDQGLILSLSEPFACSRFVVSLYLLIGN